jgi:D-alanine-D-alanine ligase-like ATP-grasp enzyme
MQDKVVVLPLVDLDDDDIDIITRCISQKDKVLIICNHASIRKSGINHIYDRLSDIPGLIRRIQGWCRRKEKRICGVVTLDEECRYRVSEAIAEHFSLAVPPRKTLDMASNKLLQKEMLRRAGLRVADYTLVSSAGLSDLRYPNVVKILTGIGSTGIYLNLDGRQLKANIQRILEESKRKLLRKIFQPYKAEGKVFRPAETFIVEEYVEGKEYSCDFVVENKKARVLRLCQKLESREHFANYDGFILYNPANWGEVALSELQQACQKVSEAYQLSEGVCMMDFKYNEGIVVLEATIRPGISTFVELMALCYGWISLDAAVAQKLGQKSNFQLSEGAQMVVYITAPDKGVIRKLDAGRLNAENILKTKIYYRAGQRITETMFRDCGALLGYALLRKVNPEEAETWVKRIRQGVDIEIGHAKKAA